MSTNPRNQVNTLPQAEPEREDTIAVSIQACPGSVWKRVRNLATERRVSAQSLWIAAMTEYLDRQPETEAAA